MAKNLSMLLLLALLWGPSFLFIKIAVQEVAPITLAALRISVGAIIVLIILKWKGLKLPHTRQLWRDVAIAGFFAMAFPFCILSWGQQYIESALAAILNGTTPIFAILLAHWLISDDKLTVPKIVGTLLSFIGLIILMYPSITFPLNSYALGIFAVIIAAASYGMGAVYVRQRLQKQDSLVVVSGELVTSAIILWPVALIYDFPQPLASISSEAWASILLMGIFGTSLAFVLYFKIIERAGASFATLVTYVMPVIGIILGTVFLDEHVGWHAYMGCFMIIGGIVVSQNRFSAMPINIFKRSKLTRMAHTVKVRVKKNWYKKLTKIDTN